MSERPSFRSQSWYRLPRAGWAAAIPCDKERDRQEPFPTGTIVEIDGEEFEVLGVEKHPMAVPIRKGEIIGLIVREPVRPASDELLVSCPACGFEFDVWNKLRDKL